VIALAEVLSGLALYKPVQLSWLGRLFGGYDSARAVHLCGLGLFALAAIALTTFAAWESRVDAPMLDVRFFRNARFSAASATITLVFFALFGFVFLSTQYLQFVLDYSPLAAGLRTLPFAGAMLLVAPFSSKLVEHFGTKRVVVIGMLTFAAGLTVASTMTTTSGYPRLGGVMLLLGAGLGFAAAPATESIMGSLPRNRAGVGSAMNDTAREVGGALGVAIVGSIVSSIYRGRLGDGLPKELPTPVSVAARDSLGSALHASSALGTDGAPIATAAREAFVTAMSRASIATAIVAVFGALIAARYLPASAAEVEPSEVNGIEPTAPVIDQRTRATALVRGKALRGASEPRAPRRPVARCT